MPSYASSSGGGRKKKRARKADSGGGRGQRDYTSLLGLLLLDAETRAAVAEQDSEEVEVLIVRCVHVW